MTYIGFDIETANYHAGSICSVGLAKVVGDEVVDSREWLVRPHESMNWMFDRCFAVHGIEWESLQDQPEFDQLWPAFMDFVEGGDLVVIHNAAFDLRHLRAVLGLYDLAPISFSYLDSLTASKRCLTELQNHQLNTVADHYGITFTHHRALDDAATCALVAHHLDWRREWIQRFPKPETQS